MKRTVRVVLLTLLALLLMAVVGIALYGDAAIKKAVNVGGPAILGVPVTLQEVSFSPLRGHITLKGLCVGNPKGYKTENLFVADRIDADVDMQTLLSDTIVIRKILVTAPQITFERGLRNSNLGALSDQLGNGAGSPKAPTAPSRAVGAKTGRKVVVDELTITDGKVRLSITAAMGLSAPITLAELKMTNIGREGGMQGLGVADVTRIVLGTVVNSVFQAVGGVGGLAADGARAIGGGAQKVGEATKEGFNAIGGAKAVAGAKAMGDGAAEVGGAAEEGVKHLGNEIGKAVGHLLSNNQKTNTPALESPGVQTNRPEGSR